MLAKLPSRIHETPDPERRRRSVCREGRAVCIDGTTYKTMAEAGRALKISRQRVRYLIVSGKADYA